MIAEKEKTYAVDNKAATEEICNDNFLTCKLLKSTMTDERFREVVGADEKPDIEDVDPGILRKILEMSDFEKQVLAAVLQAKEDGRLNKILEVLSVEQNLFICNLLDKFSYVG